MKNNLPNYVFHRFSRYYDLEKWEAKRQKKNELKALKKAGKTLFSIADDEKRHEMLHRRVDKNKYGIRNSYV